MKKWNGKGKKRVRPIMANVPTDYHDRNTAYVAHVSTTTGGLRTANVAAYS